MLLKQLKHKLSGLVQNTQILYKAFSRYLFNLRQIVPNTAYKEEIPRYQIY